MSRNATVDNSEKIFVMFEFCTGYRYLNSLATDQNTKPIG